MFSFFGDTCIKTIDITAIHPEYQPVTSNNQNKSEIESMIVTLNSGIQIKVNVNTESYFVYLSRFVDDCNHY